MNRIKNQYIVLCLIALLALGLWLYNAELYGDVFRLMLIPLGLWWLSQKQYRLMAYFVCVVAVILGIAFVCKLTFTYIASHYGDLQSVQDIKEIAKRPINGEFKGFPSGHTTAAFTAAALMWYFMGKQWGILAFILALFVGYSRIISLWHTPMQVCAGAFLGFVGSLALIMLLNKIDKTCKKDYNPRP